MRYYGDKYGDITEVKMRYYGDKYGDITEINMEVLQR